MDTHRDIGFGIHVDIDTSGRVRFPTQVDDPQDIGFDADVDINIPC